MSRTVKFILFIIVIFIAFIIYLLQTNSSKLNDEIAYHNLLQRTIVVKSSAFENEGTIPVEFTAKGANISPPLSWENLPEGTRSVAIIVTDYDAPSPKFQLHTVGHWVLYNIPLGVTDLEKGITAEKLKSLKISVGKNNSDKHEYTGPNPPLGVHTYYFRVYALDFQSLFITNDNREELLHAMKNHVLGYGELIGKF